MRRYRILKIAGLVLVAALLFFVGVGAAAFHGMGAGWYVHKRSPVELAALLRPAEVVLKPDGAGPFPAVLMFHGCGGIHAGDRQWAQFFRQQGFVVVQVDSLGPRDMQKRFRDVCRGIALWGRERAGDVLVTLDDVRKWPFVDGKHIVLAGWSHGGWSIMDLLALDSQHQLPTSLSQAPSGGLDGVAGVVLIYPYAGYPALSMETPWHVAAPTLMLLSGKDTIVPTAATLAAAQFQQQHGQEIDVHVYEGLDHCWDQPALPRFKFDGQATSDAHARVAALLQRVRAGGGGKASSVGTP